VASPYLRQMLTNFQNSFTGILWKNCNKSIIIIQPRYDGVATLPCEI